MPLKLSIRESGSLKRLNQNDSPRFFDDLNSRCLILATITKAAWLSSTEPEKFKNLSAESTAGDGVSRMMAESAYQPALEKEVARRKNAF